MDDLSLDMLKALKAQHQAIDLLLAERCLTDTNFFPSRHQIWPDLEQAHMIIKLAEFQLEVDAWAQLTRVFEYLDAQKDLAFNAHRNFAMDPTRTDSQVADLGGCAVIIRNDYGPLYEEWIGLGDAAQLIESHLNARDGRV